VTVVAANLENEGHHHSFQWKNSTLWASSLCFQEGVKIFLSLLEKMPSIRQCNMFFCRIVPKGSCIFLAFDMENGGLLVACNQAPSSLKIKRELKF